MVTVLLQFVVFFSLMFHSRKFIVICNNVLEAMKDNKKVCTMTFTNLVPNDQSED